MNSAETLRRLAAAGVTLWLGALPSVALERASAVARDLPDERDWSLGPTCAISYFNICTGWLWIWRSQFGERFGMTLQPCCNQASLDATEIYCWDSGSPGRGYSGTIALYTADEQNCPDVLLEQRPFLPHKGSNLFEWGFAAPGRLVVAFWVFGGDGSPRFVTDHPAAGPTGPPAAGNCYPTTRITHSFHWGTPGSPLCPGSPLHDATGSAEWYGWYAYFSCNDPTSVRESVPSSSWADIKALYR
jgi:hypothetical protein